MTTHDRNPSPTWACSHSWCDRKLHHKPQNSWSFWSERSPIFKLICCSKNRFNDDLQWKRSLTEFSLQNEAIQNSSNFIHVNLGLGFIGIGSSRLKRVIHWPQRSCSKTWTDFLIRLPSSTGGASFLDFTCMHRRRIPVLNYSFLKYHASGKWVPPKLFCLCNGIISIWTMIMDGENWSRLAADGLSRIQKIFWVTPKSNQVSLVRNGQVPDDWFWFKIQNHTLVGWIVDLISDTSSLKPRWPRIQL